MGEGASITLHFSVFFNLGPSLVLYLNVPWHLLVIVSFNLIGTPC